MSRANLEPAAARAVTAGTRYRKALVVLAGVATAAVFATLVIVIVVLSQSSARGKENHGILTSQDRVIRALGQEIAALNSDNKNRVADQRKLISDLRNLVQREDGTIRRYLLQLIHAIENGTPLQDVVIAPPTATATRVVSGPTTTRTKTMSPPGRPTTRPRPSPSTTCLVNLLPLCIPRP